MLGEPNVPVYTLGMGTQYSGSCRAPEVPAQYQSVPALGGSVPLYLAVSVGMDVQAAPPPAPGAPRGSGELGLVRRPAVLADLSVLVFGALAARHDDSLFALSAAAYFLGGPVNHIARRPHQAGSPSLGIRAAGAATAVAIAGAIIVNCFSDSADTDPCGGWAVLLPLGPLAAIDHRRRLPVE